MLRETGGAAWGTAVKMCFREEGTFDRGLGRSWIGTFGSGRALQEEGAAWEKAWKGEAGVVQFGQN